MKFQFWSVGKNHEPYVKEGIAIFTKRISNYYPVEWNIIPMPKNAASLGETDLKKKEGEIITGLLQKDNYLVLLEETGKMLGSDDLQISNSKGRVISLSTPYLLPIYALPTPYLSPLKPYK
jgi:23S rRNA (pseudouridine1915-N3)-methyltransferase